MQLIGEKIAKSSEMKGGTWWWVGEEKGKNFFFLKKNGIDVGREKFVYGGGKWFLEEGEWNSVQGNEKKKKTPFSVPHYGRVILEIIEFVEWWLG